MLPSNNSLNQFLFRLSQTLGLKEVLKLKLKIRTVANRNKRKQKLQTKLASV